MSVYLKNKLSLESNAVSTSTVDQEDLLHVPHHVAIIMDGNRRWARIHNLPATLGHWKGAEAIMQIVKSASHLGIKVLTVFAFSTENWTRSMKEVEGLMNIFRTYLQHKKEEMIAEGVKLDVIGDLSRVPKDLQETLLEVKEATKSGAKIDLVLALNYGGRDDIVRAVKRVMQDQAEGKITVNKISEEVFCTYLDTAKWPDPDLLIRTSGEKRLSNFLLWQLSYTEVVITDVLWPEFTSCDLKQAIIEYQQRKRRRGGL